MIDSHGWVKMSDSAPPFESGFVIFRRKVSGRYQQTYGHWRNGQWMAGNKGNAKISGEVIAWRKAIWGKSPVGFPDLKFTMEPSYAHEK